MGQRRGDWPGEATESQGGSSVVTDDSDVRDQQERKTGVAFLSLFEEEEKS